MPGSTMLRAASRSGKRFEPMMGGSWVAERQFEESEHGSIGDHVEEVAVAFRQGEALGGIGSRLLSLAEMRLGQRSSPQSELPGLVVASFRQCLEQLLGVGQTTRERSGAGLQLREVDEHLPQQQVSAPLHHVGVRALQDLPAALEISRPHALGTQGIERVGEHVREHLPVGLRIFEFLGLSQERGRIDAEHEFGVGGGDERERSRAGIAAGSRELDRPSGLTRRDLEIAADDLDPPQVCHRGCHEIRSAVRFGHGLLQEWPDLREVVPTEARQQVEDLGPLRAGRRRTQGVIGRSPCCSRVPRLESVLRCVE